MVNLTIIKQRIKTQSKIYITIPCTYVRKQAKWIQRIIHRWQYKAEQEDKFHSQSTIGQREKVYWEKGALAHNGHGWGPGNIPHWVWLCGCATSNLFFKPFIHVLPILPGDYQLSSVTQSCPTLRDTMDCSMPVLPVHHELPELIQTHVHWVSDAIQPSHPLSSPSPPAFNLSQHQGLFQWISSSHQVAKVLELQLQHLSFPMNIQYWSPLGWTGLISWQSKGLSRVFSNTTVQKHPFFCTQLSLWPIVNVN